MAKRPYWGRGEKLVYCAPRDKMVKQPCMCKACAGKRASASNILVKSDSFFDGKHIDAVGQRVTSKRHLKEVAAQKGITLEFA